METFADSQVLARDKNTTGLFGQTLNFVPSGKAEAGAAGEQPARNILTDGNDKAAISEKAALPLNHFYRNA